MIYAIVGAVVLVVAAAGMAVARKVSTERAARRITEQRLAMDAALAGFVERAIEAGSIEQVVEATCGPFAHGLGVPQVMLLRKVGGEWTAQAAPGGDPLEPPPASLGNVFTWMARNPEGIFVDSLADRRYGALRLPIAELAGRYGADVLLPLAHRGELVGVMALAARPGGASYREDERAFIAHLHLEAAAAAANASLLREVALRANLERELDLALAIQRELVPERAEATFGPVEVAGHYRAGDAGGSDFWTWREIGNGRVLVLVGDVAGDGLAASMLTAVALGAWDAITGLGTPEPGLMLEQLNQAMYRPAIRSWMTCGAAVVDPRKQTITFANAGLPFPYVLAQKELGCLAAPGLALGDRLESRFQGIERPLRRGETVVFYTRGLVERPDAEGRPYGDRRLQRALRGAARLELDATKLRDKLLDDLSAWSGGVSREDEALLVLRVR